MNKNYDIKHLSGVLNIKLTKKPYTSGSLMNEFAEEDAKIKSVGFAFEFDELYLDSIMESYSHFSDHEKLEHDAIQEIYKQIAIKDKKIKVVSESNTIYEFDAPNKKHFTIKDLEKLIVKVEKKDRQKTNWFGGIDVHHIFFEGFHKEGDKYRMYWGS